MSIICININVLTQLYYCFVYPYITYGRIHLKLLPNLNVGVSNGKCNVADYCTCLLQNK